jgi:hypothetical protein
VARCGVSPLMAADDRCGKVMTAFRIELRV